MEKKELATLESYLKRTFGNDTISVRARPRKDDSAEVYIGEEFVGVLYRDEDEGELSWNFTMAILEVDVQGRLMPVYTLDGIAPEIAADAWVAPTAVVVGRVRILPGASVWWGAVLRGDNDWITVGEGSNIQDGSVCHTDIGAPLTVGAGVTVGHGVILHGCTIGDGALVGMGAAVLNRARLGAAALLGAKALLPEGKEVPDRTLAVGAPAKVIRDLSDAEVAAIAAGCADYVAKAVRYRDHCHPAG